MGAPIDSPPEHLAVLRDVGVHDVDLMLTKPVHLDMALAGDFSRTTLQEFA